MAFSIVLKPKIECILNVMYYSFLFVAEYYIFSTNISTTKNLFEQKRIFILKHEPTIKNRKK